MIDKGRIDIDGIRAEDRLADGHKIRRPWTKIALVVLCTLLYVLASYVLIYAAERSTGANRRPSAGRVERVDSPSSMNPAQRLSGTVTADNQLFLPLLMGYKPPTAKLGVDFGFMTTFSDVVTLDYPMAKELGANWIRVWMPWAEIETSPDEYDWTTYDRIFDRLNEVGLVPLVVIYNAPVWAANESCGPVSDTEALQAFLRSAVTRYGESVAAWEFINEPDGGKPHEYGPAIGCWGHASQQYAQQLRIFYFVVRDLDPGAQVFFGGLAYDGWDHFVRDFFPQTLAAGAGPFFDGVSLHYYPINAAEFPDISYKIDEIKEIMAQHAVYDKPIWITETSMWVNENGSLASQQDYILRAFSRAFCSGADNVFWYAVRQEPGDPHLHRWLIDIDHQPDNAFDTYQFYAGLLSGARCSGRVQNVPDDVEAYRFDASTGPVYVLWSNAAAATVSLPAPNGAVVRDQDGTTLQTLPSEEGRVTLEAGARPVFLLVQ